MVRLKRATPEELLRRAMEAESIEARARYAQAGLASRRLDGTVQAMLLRQLYLCHFEERRFDRARELAVQAVELGVLPDVLRHDAARAAWAAGDVDGAALLLRAAARSAPASRKAFHCWTLGSMLFFAHRYAEAIAALAAAVRRSSDEHPLYTAHLALARIAGGHPVEDLPSVIRRLGTARSGRGYGRFVLGHLLYAAGRWAAATRCLARFIAGLEGGRAATAIALEAELRMSRATLRKMADE